MYKLVQIKKLKPKLTNTPQLLSFILNNTWTIPPTLHIIDIEHLTCSYAVTEFIKQCYDMFRWMILVTSSFILNSRLQAIYNYYPRRRSLKYVLQCFLLSSHVSIQISVTHAYINVYEPYVKNSNFLAHFSSPSTFNHPFPDVFA